MPTIARRTIAAAALAVAIIAAALALDLPSAAAQSDDEQAGRIVARRLDDGRTEFGWRPAGGARVLPRLRYFPADARVDRWLNSSPVEVDGAEIGQINARLTDDGRIEFAFTPTDGERIAPPARYFPADATVGRWLRSTEIAIGPPAPATGFIAVSAAGFHTCAIRTSGAIECWGWNNIGQTDAPAGRDFSAVSASVSHNCAIRESGEIACWGGGVAATADVPAGPFIAVSAGDNHNCAIRKSGEITCWGHDRGVWLDAEGRVVGTFANGQTDPPAGSFSAVSAAQDHTCAIRTSGEIECWGANGIPIVTADGEQSFIPVGRTDAPAGSFSAASAGLTHTCALRTSGAIECWGDNSGGQNTPPAGRDFSAVSASLNHNCAIRESGELTCWGWNPHGQLDAPAGPFIAVAAGFDHTCALRESGEIECWGSNSNGQLDAPDP